MTPQPNYRRELAIVEKVDALAEEVRILALNLAIYLAKAKAASAELNQLEPDFIRLVNGSVKVAQEVGQVIGAARNLERTVYEPPSGNLNRDKVEVRLRSILDQCGRVLSALSRARSEQPRQEGFRAAD